MKGYKLVDQVKLLTPVFRASYPALFKTAVFDGEDTGKYQVSMIWDPAKIKADEDETARFKALQKAVKNCAIEFWGSEKKIPHFNYETFRKGKPDDAEEYQGVIWARAKSSKKPGVVDQQVEDIIDPNDFYPGCYARATVGVYAYDTKGNKGVSFELINIQKVADGEPLAGKRSKPTEDFDAVAGGVGEDGDVDDLFEEPAGDDADDLLG